MVSSLNQLRKRSARWFSIACVYHTALAAGAIVALYHLNGATVVPDPTKMTPSQLWLNSAILGSIGSLLYFSRKAYVYLITDKVGRLYAEATKALSSLEPSPVDDPLDITVSKINGYVLYLYMRPLAGLVIGPLLVMMILAGLSTIGRGEVSAQAISPTGITLVLVLSFVGGYKSSDMFDHFSKIGAKFIRKSDE